MCGVILVNGQANIVVLLSITFVVGAIAFVFMLLWIFNTETPKEKIERKHQEKIKNKKDNVTKHLPKVKAAYEFCLSYTPNINNIDYGLYVSTINERFCVEVSDYYCNENRYVTLNNFQIYKRNSFSIWYTKIQNLKIEIRTTIDDYVQTCEIVFWIFYEGSVYYEEIEESKWEDTCAHISFDYNHLEDAKRFCKIIKTIIELNKKL